MIKYQELAFPSGQQQTGEYTKEPVEWGMTLRDYFAAKAMQATLINSTLSDEELAIDSYKMADAMMEAKTEQ